MFTDIFTTYNQVTPAPENPLIPSFKDVPSITSPAYMDSIKSSSDKGDDDFYSFFKKKKEIPKEESSSDSLDANTIQTENNIIATARKFLGGKYTWGGTSPETGFDCSGFIQYVYKQNGINIPRSSTQIAKVGKEVSLQDVQPGDIIYSRSKNSPSQRHIQMVSKVENGQIYTIEAKGKKYGIVEDKMWTKPSDILSVRRILSPSTFNAQKTMPMKPSKNEFINSMTTAYKRALNSKGLDPNYAYVLVAQDALESGWGKHQSGTYNFGGIKAGKNTNGQYKRTREYSTGKGFYYSNEKFRNFENLDDYCNYKIQLLSNNRYNAFNQFSSSDPSGFIQHILNKGYGAAEGGKYLNAVMKNINTIRQVTG